MLNNYGYLTGSLRSASVIPGKFHAQESKAVDDTE